VGHGVGLNVKRIYFILAIEGRLVYVSFPKSRKLHVPADFVQLYGLVFLLAVEVGILLQVRLSSVVFGKLSLQKSTQTEVHPGTINPRAGTAVSTARKAIKHQKAYWNKKEGVAHFPLQIELYYLYEL